MVRLVHTWRVGEWEEKGKAYGEERTGGRNTSWTIKLHKPWKASVDPVVPRRRRVQKIGS
jgi:hypothetical protein